MGCDIHYDIEGKVFDKWESCKTIPDVWRNYTLFSVLANVRNGHGFAGCDTGNPITPISKPRGIPDDANDEFMKRVEDWSCDGHSASFVTLDELNSYDWNQAQTHRGFMKLEEYAKLMVGGKPDSWYGGVDGGRIVHLNSSHEFKMPEKYSWWDIMRNGPSDEFMELNGLDKKKSYYIKAQWETPLCDSVKQFLSSTLTFMNFMKASEKYDDVRMVFFFDN